MRKPRAEGGGRSKEEGGRSLRVSRRRRKAERRGRELNDTKYAGTKEEEKEEEVEVRDGK